jgi:hypothetical protein
MTMNCVITGCALIDPAQNRWTWGDLYEESDCYIHYCIQQHWEQQMLPPTGCKAVHINDNKIIFERKGVVVIEKSRCFLNSQASECLSRDEQRNRG